MILKGDHPLPERELERLRGYQAVVSDGVAPRRLRRIFSGPEAAARAREIIGSRGMWGGKDGAPLVLAELASCIRLVIAGGRRKSSTG